MTLPSEYNKISMGDVRTELNKSSGPISLNDDDVRILFQVSRTSGTIISLHNGHGKSNIMPPVVAKPPLLVDPLTLITQTSVTVTWKAYESLVIDGQVDYYRVQVYSVPDNVLRWDSSDLPRSATTVNVIGLIASAVHLVTNYRVDVMAKNISATKTSSLDLLTLENIPLLPSKPVATVISKTQIQVGSASTYATTYYIYKDGASIPITTSSMPYTDTVGVYTDHTYTVKGHSTGGDGPISVSSDSVRSLPDAPLAVVFTPYSSTNTTLTINWTLSTSPVVKYYKLVVVNFGTTTEVYSKNDVSNTTTSITILTNLAATSQYTATLETVNESSIFYNIPVSIAEDVWTKTNAVAGTPVVTKLTDQTLGQSQLQVEWNSVIGATSYKLVRTKVISGVAQTPVTFTVAPTGTSTLTFIDGDLATSPSVLSSYSYYRYNVISVNAGGDSALSTISDDVRTLPGPPEKVTNLQVTLPNITDTTAIATWTDDTGQVNSYTAILKQGATTIDTKANIAPGTQTVTFGPPTALTQDTAYSVSVTTYNDNTPPATTAPVAFRTKLTTPSAPTVNGVTDPTNGQTQLTVSWPVITGATSYNLVRYNNTTSTSTTLIGVTASGSPLTYLDTGLVSYNYYKYALVAVNAGGPSVASPYSSPDVRTLPKPAVKVTDAQVLLTGITPTQATVTWSKPTQTTGDVILKYTVDVNNSSNTTLYSTDVTDTTAATLSFLMGTGVNALTTDTAYKVVIRTINENTPAASDPVSFRTKFTKPSTAIAVTQVLDTTLGKTTLSLQWDSVAGATYKIVRNGKDSISGVSEAKTFTVSPTINNGTGKATFIDGDPLTTYVLVSYELYYYNLILVNAGGDSVISADSNSVRTLPDRPKAPATVTINISDITYSTVLVSWSTAVGQVTDYTVTLTDENGATLVEKTGITTTSTTLGQTPWTALTAATKYGVIITTTNTNTDTSQASTTVKYFATKTTVPLKPTISSPTSASLVISWTNNSANAYDLIRTNKADQISIFQLYVTNNRNATVIFQYTQSAAPFAIGNTIIVYGSNYSPEYNGSFVVTSCTTTEVTYVYPINVTNIMSQSTGGTVSLEDTTTLISNVAENPYTNSVLSPYRQYSYKVISKMTLGGDQTSPSSDLTRTLPNSPVAVSSITVSVKANTLGATSMTVTVGWTNNNWATQYGVVTKYDIIMTPNGSATDYGTTSIAGSATSQDLLSVPTGTLFNVTVKTYNAVGNATSSVQFTSPPSQPGTPYLDTGVTPNPTQTKISLKWTAVGGVLSSYTLTPYRSSDSVQLTQVTNIGSNIVDYTSTAGSSYYFTVTAVNIGGSSIASSSVTLASLADVPTNVTAAKVASSTNLTVTWDSMTGATSYKVYRTEVVGGVDQTEEALGAKARGFTDTLSGEKTYYYKVTSVTTNGGESAKSTKSANTTTYPAPPGTPGTITISNLSYNQFTATWSAGTGTTNSYTATVYNTASPPVIVYPATVINSPTVTKDFGLPIAANTNYTVHVTASNTGGTSAAQTKAVLTLPAKLAVKPSATAGTNGLSVVVTWIASSTVTYNVYANGTAVGNKVAPNLSFASTAGTYTHTTIKGTEYVYYVEAVNASGGTMSDGSTSITTPDVPGAPTIGTASLYGTTSTGAVATVNWTAPGVTGGSAITGYKITSSNGETAISTATSVNINIASATECTFTVKATNAVGDSTASSASGKVCGIRAPTLSAPVVAESGNQLVVTVTATDGATDWQVQYLTNSGTTWPSINVLGTFFAYTARTTATTLNVSSTTNWNFAAFQKKVINGTTYYSGPAYAHGTITVTTKTNEAQPVGYRSIDYVIPGGTVSITAAGGGGGGGGAGGVTSLVAGGNGAGAYAASSTHVLPANTRSLGIDVGYGGTGGKSKVTYTANAYTAAGSGSPMGGYGGNVGQASTASGMGGGGGGSSAIWTVNINGSYLADLMICGGGGAGGGGLGGNAGNNAASVTTVTTTYDVANAGGTDGFSSAVATSTAAGGGGGGGSGGIGGAASTSAGTSGQFWRNTTTASAWTAPTTSSLKSTGGAGAASSATVGTAATSGGNGFMTLTYTTYVPSNLGTGQV